MDQCFQKRTYLSSAGQGLKTKLDISCESSAFQERYHKICLELKL